MEVKKTKVPAPRVLVFLQIGAFATVVRRTSSTVSQGGKKINDKNQRARCSKSVSATNWWFKTERALRGAGPLLLEDELRVLRKSFGWSYLSTEFRYCTVRYRALWCGTRSFCFQVA